VTLNSFSLTESGDIIPIGEKRLNRISIISDLANETIGW
jgi:hypothetical protein